MSELRPVLDKQSRTDPATCLHNVVFAGATQDLGFFVDCISCRTDITDPTKRVGKNYEYDLSHNVWVHISKKG